MLKEASLELELGRRLHQAPPEVVRWMAYKRATACCNSWLLCSSARLWEEGFVVQHLGAERSDEGARSQVLVDFRHRMQHHRGQLDVMKLLILQG